MRKNKGSKLGRGDGAVREYLDTLPDLRIALHPLPWTWRISFWRDVDMTSTCRGQFGPLVVEWWSN